MKTALALLAGAAFLLAFACLSYAAGYLIVASLVSYAVDGLVAGLR